MSTNNAPSLDDRMAEINSQLRMAVVEMNRAIARLREAERELREFGHAVEMMFPASNDSESIRKRAKELRWSQ